MKFWKNKWCDNTPLVGFLSGFVFYGLCRYAWVLDVRDISGWTSRLGMQLNDWELEEVEVLYGRLCEYSIIMGT